MNYTDFRSNERCREAMEHVRGCIMKAASYTDPDTGLVIEPRPVDKSTRIQQMLELGRTDLGKWMHTAEMKKDAAGQPEPPRSNDIRYTEIMTKQADVMATLNGLLDKGKGALSSIAPGELGWGLVGAGGGAMLGYTLARLLHRKPGAKTKLLYALLGAAAGGIGSHFALKNMPAAGGNGSKLDEIRESASSDMPEPIPVDDRPARWNLPFRGTTTAVFGTVGAIRGANAKPGGHGILTPDVYGYIRRKTKTDLGHLEDRLKANPTLQTDAEKKNWLNSVGNRFYGYRATQDSEGNLKLIDEGHNMTQKGVNAAAGALTHAALGLALHTGLNYGLRGLSQDIDASNAAATRDQLIRNFGQ